MANTLDYLIQRVRSELRAEGPDGGGHQDFLIIDAINAAQKELSAIFPVRDTIKIDTQEDVNTYDISADTLDVEIETIVRVTYDGKPIRNISLDDYFGIADPNTGAVNAWVVWGDALIFTGKVEADKEIALWINRLPQTLKNKDDTSEFPSYAEEAIIHFAIAAAYRESVDYDRAQAHYNIFLARKNDLLRRAVPQKQRDRSPQPTSSYWPPVTQGGRFRTSDTNPGGEWR